MTQFYLIVAKKVIINFITTNAYISALITNLSVLSADPKALSKSEKTIMLTRFLSEKFEIEHTYTFNNIYIKHIPI